MEIKINDEYKVEILKQDHFGRGICRIDDKIVFVENTLSGELCTIKITDIKKKYLNAEVINIEKENNNRQIPKCPYYKDCGGCHIMHEDYQIQLDFKMMKVKELLERNANLNIKLSDIIYDKEYNYRNKVIFHGDNQKIGFYHNKTHKVIEVTECIITDKRINKIYKNILTYINKKDIKELMIRTNSSQEVMLDIKGNIKENNLKDLDVETIYLNNKLIKGTGYITEDILGLKFKIYQTSFFQINYNVMLKMYQKVIDFYKDKNYNKVLDLYCGTGTMGMLISKYVKEVIGVEIEKSSIESALECSKINNIKNISFKEGKVENYIDEFKNIDSIIFDPPRSGLDNHTIEIILKILPKSIIYISCDPATLTRDLNYLKDKYDIIEIQPFDMFPNTYHVENMAVLIRKNI